MKKRYMLILILSLAYLPLNAQNDAEDSDLTIKITPSVYAEGRLYFSGNEQKQGETITTDGDAEARIKTEADYKGIVGAVIELEGDFNNMSADAPSLGFGDDAYVYAHILKIFGFDEKIFDIYLRGGRFETEFQNAQYGGDDDWRADVAALTRDGRINMQVDFKLLDMLTLRYALGFDPFEKRTVSDLVSVGWAQTRKHTELSKRLDMGFGLLFEKTFGIHKIQASVGYSLDVSPNRGAFGDASALNNVSYFTIEGVPADFDQFGLSVAYSATLGRVAVAPFANLTLSSLIHRPYGAYQNPLWTWSAGGKISYQDPTNDYDIFGIALDFDGSIRENGDYSEAENKQIQNDIDYIANKAFTGFQVKVWSDFLKSIMGKNYLSFWGKHRFEFWTPDIDVGGEPLKRVSVIASWGFGAEQRIINKENATVKITAEFNVTNLAPFSAKGSGFYAGLDGSNSFQGPRQDELLRVYLDVGLDASFTSILRLGKKK